MPSSSTPRSASSRSIEPDRALIGCSGQRAEPNTIPSFSRLVTAIGVFSYDLPTRYRRVEDTPGWTYVLWSHERLCIVDGELWIRTHVGDHVECEWRAPR